MIGAVVLALAGATYYVAPGGNDAWPGSALQPWATVQHAADTMSPGDAVLVRAGTYHERVVVTRSGDAGAELLFAAYPGETPVLDGTGVSMPDDLAGLFEVSLASWVRVRGLTLRHGGPYALNAGFLLENAQHVVLESNVVDTTVSSGIGVWGCQDVTLVDNEVVHACAGGMEEQISVAGTTTFSVLHNRVHDAGAAPIGGEGICLKDGSSGGLVHGNAVWNVPERLGIYVDAWDKHTFDVRVDGNVVHHCREGLALASEMGGLLENIRVTNNVAWANAFRGLLVADYGGVPDHPVSAALVANNTFAGNGTSGWGGGIAVDSLQAQGVVLRNNIVSGNASFTIVVSPSLPSGAVGVDHNLIDGFMGDEGETRGTEYVEGDPLFVSAAVHDYHLSAGSPAIDHGSALAAPLADFDGVARPQGSAVDIGAFERAAPAAATSLYTVPPCRVLDTRDPDGSHGGPALLPSSARVFAVAGRCAVPADARAVSANVTVTAPAAAGFLTLHPAGGAVPTASTVNFEAGRTRANNAVVLLSSDGTGSVALVNGAAGAVHAILDVNGYFR